MKSASAILGFKDRWLMIIGIPVVSLLMSALMFGDLLVRETRVFFTAVMPLSLTYTLVYWISFRYLMIFFRIRFPLHTDTGRRLIYQGLSVVAIYFGLKKVLDPILHGCFDPVMEDELRHNISMSIGSLIVTFLVLGVYETMAFYNQLQKTMLDRERLLRENAQSQLEGLKNQVNPHFFFNSLNTLAYLIPEDPVKAENFVQKLSKAYRYILEIRDRQLVTLEEELKFLDSYTCLLKERFGNNLIIDIQIPDNCLTLKIIPLSLQMLFENAIKHNVVSTQDPLQVRVYVAEGQQLVVRNNLQLKKQQMPSTRIGLENIIQRYHLVSEKEVEVRTTHDSFIVILPLIGKDVQVMDRV